MIKTTFVQVETPIFGRITGGCRWIVLNREGAELYREKFGDENQFSYLEFDPFLMDSTESFSYLSVRDGSSGEGYALEKHDGQWLARRLWKAHYD